MLSENTKVAEENAEALNEPKQPTKKQKAVSLIKKYPVITTALVGLIAVVAVYFWKDIQGNKQKAAIEQMAATQLKQNNETMLKLMAKPLVWSIRAEMLRGNMEQVNIFTSDLVKEKNFQFIYLVDPAGMIIVSTDKKMEGQPVGDMFAPALVQTDSVVVLNDERGILTMAAPVMGFDKRLAVIILNYAPQGFVNEKDLKSTGPDNTDK